MPKISIIVPVFKVEKYIHRCLDSIINQTFSDWECILIDDGSPDNSGKICDEYAEKDTRFRVIHQENQGVSAARNAGLDAAKGEWIGFVDSDDWIASEYVEVLTDNKDNIDILMFSNEILYDDGGKTILILENKLLTNQIEFEDYILSLKNRNYQNWEFFGYVWNKCYRRDIIQQYGIQFPKNLSYREDNVFNEAYYRHTRSMKVIPRVLYYYRFSTTGLTYKEIKKQDYLNIARGLEINTEGISLKPLFIFDKKRILDFYLLATCGSYDYALLREIRRYVKKYPELELSTVSKLSFRGNILINLLFYVVFYVFIPFCKKKMVN